MAYRINFARSLSTEFSRIVTEQIDFALECLDGATGEAETEAVHAFRKTTKKLRTVFRMVRGALPEPLRQQLMDSLRTAAAHLAANRNATVLDTLFKKAYRAVHRNEGRTVRTGQRPLPRISHEQAEDPGTVAERVALARCEIVKVRSLITQEVFGNVGFPQLAREYRRSFRRGRKLLAALEIPTSDETTHCLRKRAKDHLYQLQLLSRLAHKRMRAKAKQFDALAETLGELHDAQLLLASLHSTSADSQIVLELDNVRTWLLTDVTRLEKRAVRVARLLYAQSPRRTYRRALRDYRDARRT